MFYDNYVKQCNKIGKSPSAAAVEMGFHRSEVTRWSKGSTPRRANLQRMATYFDCSISDLLVEETDEKSPAAGGDGGGWADMMSVLDANDVTLVGQVVEQLRDNPEAMRAALDLALAAVQSGAQFR